MEQLQHELMFIWDTGIVGSGLTHGASMVAPAHLSKSEIALPIPICSHVIIFKKINLTWTVLARSMLVPEAYLFLLRILQSPECCPRLLNSSICGLWNQLLPLSWGQESLGSVLSTCLAFSPTPATDPSSRDFNGWLLVHWKKIIQARECKPIGNKSDLKLLHPFWPLIPSY